MDIFRLGCRVRHIAWHYTGVVIDFPFEYNRQSSVLVKRDHDGKVAELWVPSLVVLMDDEEEVDWDDW